MYIPLVLALIGFLTAALSFVVFLKSKGTMEKRAFDMMLASIVATIVAIVWDLGIYAPGAAVIICGVLLFAFGKSSNPGYGSGAFGSGIIMLFGIFLVGVGIVFVGGAGLIQYLIG